MPNPYRKTKLSGANGDREIFMFPVQLTTSRIGNLTRLIHTLAISVTIQRILLQKHVRCAVIASRNGCCFGMTS